MTAPLEIKVCGMNDPRNIAHLCTLPIAMIGFIFHASSPRDASRLAPAVTHLVPPSILKVGVFVDAPPEEMIEKTILHDLHLLQLHGNESPDQCRALRTRGLKVIKTIPVANDSIQPLAAPYTGACDYLLLDTSTPIRGGSGRKFDWRLLATLGNDTPVILGGGISPDDVAALHALAHPALRVVDLNSRFETAPGTKNIPAIQQFITTLTIRES